MCDIESSIAHLMEKKCDLTVAGKQCKKCGEEKGTIVLRINEVYCKACFLPYFVHKFRASLGKSKLMKPKDVVLVAFSGGQSSTAMVHLIKDALEEDNKKKLKYIPLLLYIDEGAVTGKEMAERINDCNQIVKQISWSGFPVYVTSLEMVFKSNSCDISLASSTDEVGNIPTDIDLEKQLKSMFTSLSSLTAKEDLLLRLRTQIICKVAEHLKTTKIFLGDTGTILSIRLLADLAQGRIAQLAEDIGFSHTWAKQILVLRPMRDYIGKEIAFYNNIHNLKYIVLPTLGTKTDQRASIFRLTETFVHGLQKDFPSTVSTIFRTGDKLSSTYHSTSQELCILCQGVLDNNDDTSSQKLNNLSHCCAEEIPESIDAINHQENRIAGKEGSPQLACQKNCSQNASAEESCCSYSIAINEEKKTESNLQTAEKLKLYLCYGCKLIIKDMNDVPTLPENIWNEVRSRNRRIKMRDEISEFLLDEDESS